MLFFNVKDRRNYDFISDDDIKYVLDYFQNHDFTKLKTGKYKTERPHINFRVDEYHTEIAELRYWQSHKNHLDMYFLIFGQERIDIGDQKDFSTFHYDNLEDVAMLESGKISSSVILKKYGDVLICLPNSPHKTGVHVDLKNKFRVVLFKIEM